MKSRTLIALAVAGACTWSSGVLAGGAHHGAYDSPFSSAAIEVQTPSSVDESAPWLTGEPHLRGWHSSDGMLSASLDMHEPYAVGASADAGAGGSIDSETLASSSSGNVEYWLIGESTPERAVGSSASEGASGSVSFDSSMSESAGSFASAEESADEMTIYTSDAESIVDTLGEETTLLSEHYVYSGPISDFEVSDAYVLMIAPTEEDIALLESLKEDYVVLTPIYEFG